MQIVRADELTDPKTQMAVVDVGANAPIPAEPTPGMWSEWMRDSGLTWQQAHFGIVYGHYVLLRIEIARWIICLLHMNLRIVGGMVNKLVLYQVGIYGDAEEQSKALRAKFQEGAVWIREGQLQKKSKNADAAYKKDLSFVGCDANSICELHAELTEIVIPKKARDSDAKIQAKYDDAMECWRLWREAWRLLNNRIGAGAGAREERARAVQIIADKWLAAWVTSVGNTQGLYVHLFHTHVADMIRLVGDLRPFQSQGLEHCHSIRKLVAKLMTNRHKFGKKSRTAQALRHLTVGRWLRKFQRDDENASQHGMRERAKARKIMKRIAKVIEEGKTAPKTV